MTGTTRTTGTTWWRRTAAVVAVAGALGGLGTVGAPARAAVHGDGIRYRDEVFDGYTTQSDLQYGQAVDHQGHQQRLLLDVLEPAGDDAPVRAAVVWVHGGYFKRGSKTIEWYQEVREQYVKAGYVVFSINYRLNDSLPEGLLPTVETLRLEEYINEAKDAAHDAQAAVRWVRAHAAQYRVDPNLIAISGHSAGGIISQMVGFNEDDPGTSGTPGVSSRVAAVVSSAGGTLPLVLSDVGLDEPPMLLSHGIADQVVPYPADVPACVLTVVLGNVCEQQLDPDQDHPQFGFAGWREFLYRRMIRPARLDLPLQVRLEGLGSLLGS
jgi:predicted esterase